MVTCTAGIIENKLSHVIKGYL